jgi:hypothetical protein
MSTLRVPCVAGCGFYGDPEQNDYCSSCVKHVIKSHEQLALEYAQKVEFFCAAILELLPGKDPVEARDFAASIVSIGNLRVSDLPMYLAADIERYQLLRSFNAGLESLGYRVNSIVGKGDCLFGAVADQVYGNEHLHAHVRAFCVEYLRAVHESDDRDFASGSLKSYIKGFIPDPEAVERYLTNMSRPGVWGDDLCLRALADIYQRKIVVLMAGLDFSVTDHPDFMRMPEERVDPPPVDVPSLTLSNWTGELHFNSLISDQTLQHRVEEKDIGVAERAAIDAVRRRGVRVVVRDSSSAPSASGAAALPSSPHGILSRGRSVPELLHEQLVKRLSRSDRGLSDGGALLPRLEAYNRSLSL